MTNMKALVMASVVVVALAIPGLVAVVVESQGATGTGYEWHYMSVWGDSTYRHPATGKGLLASTLDHAEMSGWVLEHIELNRVPGETLGKWEMVFRAPAGASFVPLPSPPAPPAPVVQPPPPGPTAGGVNCPLYPIAPFPGARCYPDGGWRP